MSQRCAGSGTRMRQVVGCLEPPAARKTGSRSLRAEDLGIEIRRGVDLGQQVIDVRAGCVVEASEATKSRQSEIETHLASRLNGAEFCHASREGRRLTSRQLFDSIVIALHDLLILLGHELQRA